MSNEHQPHRQLTPRPIRTIGALAFFAAFASIGPSQALAGDVTVEAAEARFERETATAEIWTFSVTLAHADTGWEHYADQFEILSADGDVLGTRTLFHPHVNEQPFTRSLGDVEIPKGVATVFVRGRDSVHGHGPVLLELELQRNPS